MSADHPPRLRFAPSPTGFLHVGGARTALLNWLYARHTGGTFLLRIEDTDRARSTEESTRAIFDGLRWLGLDWDEQVVFQGANGERHKRDAFRLLERGLAYRDFTTAEELARQREAAGDGFRIDRARVDLPQEESDRRAAAGEPFAIRFRVPDGDTAWHDAVHDWIRFPNKDIEDFIILRSDGTPVYNLAVVSDDIEMRVTFVMRGDDHISNTPKQILLYQGLGAQLPRFAHVPMIHGIDGKKLSKRHGATAVGDYAQLGILPAAMVNFLSLLGWSPGDDTEVMSLYELIRRFSLDGLQRKAAIFDPKKLEWMNGQHLSLDPLDHVEPHITRAIVDAGLATAESLHARREWYEQLLTQLRVRARTTLELAQQARVYFEPTVTYDEEAIAKFWKDVPTTRSMLQATRDRLATLDTWTADAMEQGLRALAESLGVSGGKIFQPLRVALVGVTASPGIFDVLLLLGRDTSLARLDAAVRWLDDASGAAAS
ncbi:MAG: glutamate--tRNA ligase [Gemmatimonadaceae bacterium]|jgi:glutamyl-tRNA synthetase|nr:glutamate--tRNA ligase [Gemmatimonadaceae bacterium]